MRNHGNQPRALSHRLMRRRGHRSAWSLLELLVAMGLASVIFSSIGLTLALVFRADQRLRDEVSRSQTVESLTAQFREDAHRAMEVMTVPPERELLLSLPQGQAVRYATVGLGIERQLRVGQQVRHREVYRLVGAAPTWELEGQLLRMRLESEASSDAATVLVETIVGLDIPDG